MAYHSPRSDEAAPLSTIRRSFSTGKNHPPVSTSPSVTLDTRANAPIPALGAAPVANAARVHIHHGCMVFIVVYPQCVHPRRLSAGSYVIYGVIGWEFRWFNGRHECYIYQIEFDEFL